jgi:hypothetical protein
VEVGIADAIFGAIPGPADIRILLPSGRVGDEGG